MMEQQVVLKLDGNLEDGVKITLEIWLANQRQLEITGGLPPNLELATCIKKHWNNYRLIGAPYRVLCRLNPTSITYDGHINRIDICKDSAVELKELFQAWLDAYEFKKIDRKLWDWFSPNQAVQVLIRTSNSQLQKLPWHLWDWVESHHAEVAFSSPEYQNIFTQSSQKQQVKILAILGHAQGINIEEDRHRLQQLPSAQLTFLVEPTRRKINDHLWEKNWDILFFAGHSETEEDEGKIFINRDDSLTLDELRYGLSKAVKSGLKLAIFNSCDGLGLAKKLSDLHIPRMIIMREIIPDEVAQGFLKYFLVAFSRGDSFTCAVREARQRLHDEFDTKYPCASWLPIIFQHPTEKELTWKKLSSPSEVLSASTPISLLFQWQVWKKILTMSVIITSLIIGVRSLGFIQNLELKALDTLMGLRPDEPPDPRLLIVTVTEEDIQAQNPEELRGSLSDTALKQLLDKLNQHQPRVIGLDIYRPFPVQQNQQSLAKLLAKEEKLIVVCEVGGGENNPSIPPPKEVPLQQVGFSDVPIDPDGIVRRQLLGMSPNPECNTDKSFSYQLAYYYLKAEGIEFKRTSKNTFKIGSVPFKKLTASAGGYHQLDAMGYQVMLNYRTAQAPAQTVTLSDILNDRFDPQWIQDKIILIGTTARSIDDGFLTPYSADYSPIKYIPGVFVQAQMVSQILSAIQDNRPLLQVLPKWGEILLILGCSVMGEIILTGYVNRQQNKILFYLIMGGVSFIFIGGIGYFCLIKGVWIPIVPLGLALVLMGVKQSILPQSSYSNLI